MGVKGVLGEGKQGQGPRASREVWRGEERVYRDPQDPWKEGCPPWKGGELEKQNDNHEEEKAKATPGRNQLMHQILRKSHKVTPLGRKIQNPLEKWVKESKAIKQGNTSH